MNNLSIQQIYEIIILVEQKNIKLTAKELQINESTLRRHLAQIEATLNENLYNTNGNKLEFSLHTHEIYKKYAKKIKDYVSEYNNSINKTKSIQNTVKILCEIDYLKILTNFISQNKSNLIINVELISQHEINRLNPKKLANFYSEFDCLLLQDSHQLKMSHQWKIQSHPVISNFYYNEKYENVFSDVSSKNLQSFNILNAKLLNNEPLTIFSHNYPGELTTLTVQSTVQSDLLRINILIASKGHFIVHLPSFIPSLYPEYSLIKIPDLYLNHLQINLYYRFDLEEQRLKYITNLKAYLKQVISAEW